MFTNDGTTLKISRGDTGTATITFTTALTGAGTLLMSISEQPGKTPLVEKSVSTASGATSAVFSFDSDDTNLRPGQYFWDVQLVTSGGQSTFIEPSPCIILPTVSDGEVDEE